MTVVSFALIGLTSAFVGHVNRNLRITPNDNIRRRYKSINTPTSSTLLRQQQTKIISSSPSSLSIKIEGLLEEDEEFDRLESLDGTIRSLRTQLPLLLTNPLTIEKAKDVYTSDNFHLSVLIDDNSNSNNNNNETNEEQDIVILNNRDELIALSDVLVLATAVAQQANTAFSGGVANTTINIDCQILLDDTYQIIRIPWRANVPLIGSPNSNDNNFEGITDFLLDDDNNNNSGKVSRFVIRKFTWNGRSLNGPAIGQALKTIQSTVSNIQQNPIFQNIVSSSRRSPDATTSTSSTQRHLTYSHHYEMDF